MAYISPNDIDELVVVVNKKTSLYFNGYSTNFNKGKNSLSKTHFKSFIRNKRSDREIIELAFKNNFKIINSRPYMYNHVVYKGSWIVENLREYYDNFEYIPFDDFIVVKDPIKKIKVQ